MALVADGQAADPHHWVLGSSAETNIFCKMRCHLYVQQIEIKA